MSPNKQDMGIRVLDEDTVRKIAAGEVIDRPASVVKELIENSIDAESRHITIELKDGGKSYIRVDDDGTGIRGGEVELAFEKHSTSKIRSIEDLDRLKTLGFRGGALTSIAAVSRVKITTRHIDEDYGSFLRIDGKIRRKGRISRGVGTSVEVEDLFYNLPARLKSMKSKNTELRNIIDIVTKYAIIYPEIRFELFHDGKRILNTTGSGRMLDVIVSIFGKDIGRELIEVNVRSSENEITGYISKPSVCWDKKKFMMSYVNRRYVKSDIIDDAVKNGYGSLLPKKAYPFAVISVITKPSLINVNVHPKKNEIHFYRADSLMEDIKEAVYKSLRENELIPEVKEEIAETISSSRLSSTSATASGGYLKTFEEGAVEGSRDDETSFHDIFPLYQLYDSYIIAGNKDGDLIIIDQHAAHEKINFEQLKERYKESKIKRQELIRPIFLELTALQSLFLEENEELLERLGFCIEKFDTGYIIREVPVILQKVLKKREDNGDDRKSSGRFPKEKKR